MSRKPKGEMPAEESARCRQEQQTMYDRARKTQDAERREAEEQRVWQKDQNHNTL